MADHVKEQTAPQKPLVDHVIRIEGFERNGDLKLSDNGRTIANSEDTITWDIEPNLGVEEIIALAPKNDPNNDDVFKTGPARVSNSKKWRGQLIRINDNQARIERYSIIYRKEDGQIAIFDPIIQVNP